MQRDKLVESLNARAPSPWDKFSASPSPRSEGLEIEMRRSDGIPKLAPEVEQGNVEYKLILMNPTPERLHRLVTQLNWRLMEGNGEAYYQLGVADSGELIGLTKGEMEATLETLENMAGELGASVVISREIEVRGHLSMSLSLDSINGMGGKDMNGMISSSSTSSLISSSVTSGNATTDTETSETEGESENDSNITDSPTTGLDGEAAVPAGEGDPNEIIVRSAPVPITPSFLRRQREKAAYGSRNRARERTLMPQDFSPLPGSLEYAPSTQVIDGEENEDEEGEHHLGVFGFSELDETLDSINTKTAVLDPSLPARTKLSKPPKPSKPPKQTKGAKVPTISVPTKTPEQIARRIAEKRAKRDKRREERKLALMDPIYDHANLVTQDGGSGGINYESIVGDNDDNEPPASGNDNDWNDTMTSPSATLMISSLATLKQGSGTSAPSAAVDVDADSAAGTTARTPELQTEPRLIVEALVVRKAGFGRGFVDLSQFDEELSYLPSFSLS